ncbi:MAG: sulfatase-like hydrolase/transferase [Actinomycetota bacterium]
MTTVDASGERRRLPRPGGLDIALSILVAFNFAVAQPILDLTGRFPQFFLARRSPRVDLFLLAFGLAILVPAVVASFVWVAGLIHERLGTALHILVVGGLAGTLAIQILERVPALRNLGAPVFVVAGALLGAGTVLLYYRSRGARSFVRLAAISALLLPALFLFSSPTSRLVLRQSAAISGSKLIANPVPVVMLVVDEFPIASLMDERGGIDASMFPGFAELAAGSTWFRNATAVHDFTEIAVPAILTGSYGDKNKLPITKDYPNNIFTLLGGAYNVRAFEAFTQLCPASICTESSKPTAAFLPRWRTMLSDLRIVYEHIIAPPSLAASLPSIDQTWSDFGGGGGKPASGTATANSKVTLAEDPFGDFRRFTSSIERTTDPTFWFAHIELPHAPWRYLPSGQEYPQRSPIPGRTLQVWGHDEWLLAQAYQRHLLQAAAVDRQVGALIDRLREKGIWDRALVVVTADHGISFRAGSDLRVIAKETVGEIAAVPMFVKLPGQQKGTIDDRPVQTFDVVPTIADVLDVEGMYATDGISMFAKEPSPAERAMLATRGFRVTVRADGAEKYAVVERKLDLFGRAGGLERLYAITPGSFHELLGRSVSGVTAGTAGRVAIDSAGSYQRFDPSADVIRALMTGSLSGVSQAPRVLAIAVQGRVVAVTRTYLRSGRVRFNAMVAPESFRRGANKVEVFLVEGGLGARELRLIPQGV